MKMMKIVDGACVSVLDVPDEAVDRVPVIERRPRMVNKPRDYDPTPVVGEDGVARRPKPQHDIVQATDAEGALLFDEVILSYRDERRPATVADYPHLVEDGYQLHDGVARVGQVRAATGWADPFGPVTLRLSSARALRKALNDSGQRAAWDAALLTLSQGTRDYWDWEEDPIETSPKMQRIAAAAGVDLAALYDLALRSA